MIAIKQGFLSFGLSKRLLLSFIIVLFSILKANAQCNCDFTIPAGAGIYTFDGLTAGVNPGDVICLAAGLRERIIFNNIEGSPTEYVQIINCGGQALVGGPNANTAITFNRSRYIRITGTGDAGFKYGIKIVESKAASQGVALQDRTSDCEVDHLEITKVGFAGIMAKSDPSKDCANCSYERPNALPAGCSGGFTMYNLHVHDNYVHDIAGEGIYAGNSFYLGATAYCGTRLQYPHEIRGVRIYNNVFDNCGWESIQVGAAVQDVEIHDNRILNYGAANVYAQNGGIQVGVGSTGRVYNNFVKNGTGIAIFVQGIGDIYVFNNVIVNSGTFSILFSLRATPLPTDIVPTGYLGGVHVMNNTIVTPTDKTIKESVIGPLGNIFYNNLVVGGNSFWLDLRKDTDWKVNNNLYIPLLADAKFADPALDDYRLLSGSPAINAGIDVSAYGVTSDFENKSRPAGGAYDVGAFEVSGNPKPAVQVGANQILNFPTNATTISGAASDPDGTIESYLWTKTSGPSTTLVNESTSTLSLPALAEGVYVFRLTATDDSGETGFAECTVTVLGPVDNQPPIANAGNDKTITLPVNSTVINGSGSDPDGTVTKYVWTKISGPSATLANDNTPTLTASNLSEGIYLFRLTVTDDDLTEDTDDVKVTVQPVSTNQVPTVSAGADKNLTLPTNSTTLTGTASDPDGTIQSYTWTKRSGGSATLNNESTATLSLTGLAEGLYVFRLTVTDNNAAVAFDEATVTVSAANQAPQVSAGVDKIITLPTNSTTLTATASDADGTVAVYAWSKLSGPPATLTNESTPVVTITNLVAGTYVFRVTATDDDLAATSDDVTINVVNANIPPVANAGLDVNLIAPTNGTTLTGSGTDTDGTISAYLWEKLNGGSATLGATDASALTLSGLTEGIYTFRLTVTDNGGATHSDNAIVVVLPESINQSPTVSAGADQTISLSLNSTTLTGTASDPDGSIASYLWTKLSGPSATLSGTNSSALSLSALVQGVYTFRVTVTDNNNASASDDVIVNVTPLNQKPVVNAGVDQIVVLPANQATLTATASDVDGTVNTYLWSQQSGGTAVLSGTTTASLEASSLNIGTYVFTVLVTDDQGAQSSDNVKVIVQSAANQNPIATLGSDITIFLPTTTVNITGSASDADGTIASYTWEKISGGSATLVNETTQTVTINDLVEDMYIFRFTATDNVGASDFQEVTVRVLPSTVNQAPLVSAGPNITLTLPVNSTNLIGSASDADGSVANYSWTQVSGPAALLSNGNTTVLSLQDMVEGIYVFRLVVTDDDGATSESECQVIILPSSVNQNPQVDAGNDIVITLPTNTANILAQASDADGSILSYNWTKQIGPGATINGITTNTLSLSDLVEGNYVFKILVTDNAGGSSFDEVAVRVLASGSNQPPLVNAGPDRNLFLPTDILNLTGNASDLDGTIVSLLWSKAQGPACTLNNINSASLSLSGLVAGQYTFRLTATDDDDVSSFDEINLTVFPGTINQSPVANAGSNQTLVLPNASATFNGAGFDLDGSIVSYSWTQIQGTSVLLENINAPTLVVNNLIEGVYRFQLTVVDDDAAEGSDIVEITVVPEGTNQPPLADAGFDKILYLPDNTTTIQGSGVDTDGSVTEYLWSKLSGPSLTMTGETTGNLTLTNLVQGNYKFEFTVRDNNDLTNSDEVSVNVLPVSANTNPAVSAGQDIYLRLPVNTHVLKSSATDPNGSIISYQWTKKSGPLVTLSGVNAADLSMSNLVEGSYLFRIEVTDNDGASASDEVLVTVAPPGENIPPVVSAGSSQIIILPQTTATINGSAFEEDGFIKSLEWKQLSGPSQATLTGATSATLSASGLDLGSYVFELTAIDNEDATSSDQTTVEVRSENILPVAFAGNDTTLYLPTNLLTIEGFGRDEDGFITLYEWTQTEGPAASINIEDSPIITIFDLIEGTYGFQVTVTDNLGARSTDDIVITVSEDPVNPIGASKIFSPNSDDVNEFWTIKNLSMIGNCPIKIFNRLGKQVFTADSYENNWNGTVNGKPLQDGDYYYVVSCGTKKYTGALRLIR